MSIKSPETLTEISGITPRVHDWIQTKPLTEPWFTALRALEFVGAVVPDDTVVSRTAGLHDMLLTDDSGGEGVLLGERDQRTIADSVAALAMQQAGALAGSLTSFAQHVAPARLYAGVTIDETAFPPQVSAEDASRLFEEIYVPASDDSSVRAVTAAPKEVALAQEIPRRESQPWQKVLKLGPLVISFAVQPKRA